MAKQPHTLTDLRTLILCLLTSTLFACGGGGGSGNAAGSNTAPTANAQNLSVVEDTSLSITLSGTDPDGDSLSYTASNPAHGTLTGIAPNLSYTPNADYTGSDSFTFTVNDGTVDSAAATVSITVTAGTVVNNAPSASAQSVTTVEDTAARSPWPVQTPMAIALATALQQTLSMAR